MTKQSITDWSLLHSAGFLLAVVSPTGTVKERVDMKKLAEFCGVSLRTVRSWGVKGLPHRVRVQLENLCNGEYLPNAWRKAGIKVCHDGIELRDGVHINLDCLTFWRFIVCGVDWARVRDIEQMLNTSRATGRAPVTLVQHGFATAQQVAAAVAGQLDRLT